ncbi:TRAP transporter substrate-binding protein [Marinomonas spartinae]|uniref:TRAP transporter substrate-binding protein n=1 Tax=Marinomonas spartinae TaxID=1792290 RepID=UPI0018F1AA9D|nr:TRAP transporter substrate-binding protein [Marinomonas spartinae]MBJ7556607.1 TRAP transporter substrate-binding protein [Marinomonas spartinae]
MKFISLAKALSLGLTVFTASSVFAAQYDFTMATTTPVSSPWGKTLTNFQHLAAQYTHGKVEIKTSFGGALGNDTQLLQKAQLGSIVQGAQSSGANLGTTVHAFKVFDIPYIFNSVETGMKLFYPNGKLGGKVVDELQTLMAKKNLRLLYVMPFEFRGILTTDKKVSTPSDMKGLKMRVTPSDVERTIITSLGAGATTLGISEVYTALQTGTVDGLAIPPITAVAFGLDEVAGNFNELNFQPHGSFMTVNALAWKRLPKNIQDELQKAADDAVHNNAALFKSVLTESINKFKAKGANVIEPTAAEKKAFADVIQGPASKVATKEFNSREKQFYQTVKETIKSFK